MGSADRGLEERFRKGCLNQPSVYKERLIRCTDIQSEHTRLARTSGPIALQTTAHDADVP